MTTKAKIVQGTWMELGNYYSEIVILIQGCRILKYGGSSIEYFDKILGKLRILIAIILKNI